MLFTEKPSPAINVLQFALLNEKGVQADVLRLDQVDPIVSGNKWFKLKEYLKDAVSHNKTSILTFGGAYSNHIIATAALCKRKGLTSAGIIRGERPGILSATLQNALNWGMDLFFLEREKYKLKEIPDEVLDKYPDHYLVNEGGYGVLGKKGAAGILELVNAKEYTHVLTAVGTGTTLAGLVEGSAEKQTIVGISTMKNNVQLEDQINYLLSKEKKDKFCLFHQFHFGGYAKYNNELIQFMNDWFAATGIPSDFVYTAKMFYSFNDLLKQDHFPRHSKILLVHTGGLQGNNSLKKGTLIF